MKKFIPMFVVLLATSKVCAQNTTIVTDKDLVTRWESNKSDPTAAPGSDVITIQNGNGANIQVIITVDKIGSGINVKNCGTTTYIEAGSTAICTTSDSVNPVNFTASDPNKIASGTYQIKPQ